jgi:hypothetical protein
MTPQAMKSTPTKIPLPCRVIPVPDSESAIQTLRKSIL